MGHNEQDFSERFKIVDFLYLGVLLFGFSQFYLIEWFPIQILFFVICYSIILDWRSAIVMAQSGTFRYFISDALTVFNYFGIINSMKQIDGINSKQIVIFLIHYSFIFLIYIIWNCVVLFSNKNCTEQTNKFLNFFNILGVSAFGVCIFGIIHFIMNFSFVSTAFFKILIYFVGAIHLFELIIWTYKTYFEKN